MSFQAFLFTMLHRHLTAAYRALDSKWGNPVDLDTSEDGLPCLPAVVEKSSTTFSSEEYIRKLRRQKSYSRNEDRKFYRRKKDSFSNISVSQISTGSCLGGSVASLDSTDKQRTINSAEELVLELKDLVQQLKKPLEEALEDSESNNAELLAAKKEKLENIFKKMKDTTLSFLDLKYKVKDSGDYNYVLRKK